MLYLTTRNNADTYTAYKAITSDCGLDGGRYVPFRIPRYTSEDIAAFARKEGLTGHARSVLIRSEKG